MRVRGEKLCCVVIVRGRCVDLAIGRRDVVFGVGRNCWRYCRIVQGYE